MEKWPIFDKNHGLTPLGKWQFFDFLNFLFLYPRNTFFLLEYRKTHFPLLYCLKKKFGKMANFTPKPWTNPFGKMAIFQLFELLVFIAQKGVFSFYNILKHIFLTYISLKEKMEKWPIFDKNHGLTPLGKWQFFDFLNFLFL